MLGENASVSGGKLRNALLCCQKINKFVEIGALTRLREHGFASTSEEQLSAAGHTCETIFTQPSVGVYYLYFKAHVPQK